MTALIKALFVVAVFTAILRSPGYAATITATSCSSSNVQTAIDAAQDGDIVKVPAGSCTWSTAIRITNKTITLQGAGSGNGGTHITYGGTGHTLIAVEARNKTGKVDISGFWLSGGDSDYWDGTAMQVYGPTGWKNVRVHHMVFESNTRWSVKLGTNTHGVMDHCTFKGTASGVMTYGLGANDWSTPLTLGTADFFFFEDNTFDWNDSFGVTGVPVVDMNNGGRVVFRRNIVKYGMWETHDKVRGGLPGANAYEVYNNTFWSDTNKWKGLDISSGTGVVWGNTFTGPFTYPIGGIDYKSSDHRALPLCDGNDPADQNISGQAGWRCQYQIGSQGEGPTAVSYPLYLWNNTANGRSVGMVVTNGGNHVRANRDYFNNGSAPKPGYRPFPYPHPLQLEGNPPIQVKGLVVH